MLPGFQSEHANRRIILLKVILCVLCVALFHGLLFGQTSRGDGWPPAAGRIETTPPPSQGAAFSDTTSGFAPELSPIRSPLLRTTAPKSRPAGRSLWIASIVVLAGANVADARSSWNKDDSNPTLAGAQGKFAARGVLIKGGVNSLWVVGQLVALRKNPNHRRLLAVVNFAAASVFAIAAYHNYGIPAAGAGTR